MEYLKKEMATCSSTLAWKIPWTEEPGRLQFMGSQSRTRLSNFTHFVIGQVVFLGGSVVKKKKNLPANAGNTGDTGLIPGLERSPGRGTGNPL